MYFSAVQCGHSVPDTQSYQNSVCEDFQEQDTLQSFCHLKCSDGAIFLPLIIQHGEFKIIGRLNC